MATGALNAGLCFLLLRAALGPARATTVVAPFVLMLNAQFFALGRARQPSLKLAAASGLAVGAARWAARAEPHPAAETARATAVCAGLTLLYRVLDWLSREGRYLV